jgi:CRP-like cAMP-binding protein
MSDKLRKIKDRASKAFSDGKLKDALKLYQQVVDEDGGELACRIKVGDIHRRLGNKSEAVAAYEPVARFYAEDGMLLKAIAVCKLILSVDVAHTATQEMLANLYSKRAAPVPQAVARMKTNDARTGEQGVEIDIDEDDDEPMVVERSATDVASVRNEEAPAPQGPTGMFAWPSAQVIVGTPVVMGEKVEGPPAAAPPPLPAAWPVSASTASQEAEASAIEEEPIELNKVARPAMGMPIDEIGRPQIPLFSDLPRDAFIEILVQMTMREMSPGDCVIREGEVGNSFFVLAQGKVRVSRRTDDGSDTILAYLTDGAFFGEMALLQDGARTASVIVEEDSQIFELSKPLLDKVVEQFPSVAKVLRNFYTQRLLSTAMAIHPLFRPFGPNERRALMELFKSKPFKANDVLLEEGKKGEGLYILLTGTLEVTKVKDGAPVQIAELVAGDMFGEISLLTNRPTVATVRAVTDCFVLRLSKKNFDELIMTHPQVLELVSQISDERQTENTAIFGSWSLNPQGGAALV